MLNNSKTSPTQSHPLVSIIVPVYNTEKYLAECIDSIILQTYPNIEIICINDGSTDKSLLVLEKYAKKDSRVKILSQKNAGVVVARNKAIQKAKGKYILPLDSDDKIAATCIEKLLELVGSTGCAVAAPGVELFGGRQGPFSRPEPTAQNMAFSNSIVNCSLFEKRHWKKYGGFDSRFDGGIEDYDFWWNFLQDRKTISRTNEVLFYYRIKDDESSRNEQTRINHGALFQIMLEKYPLLKKLRTKPFAYRALRLVYRKSKLGYKKISHYTSMAKRIPRILSWREYKNYVLHNHLDKQHFVPITEDPYAGNPPKKLIAYYLPQYYQIPQNDDWFGRGFTEWTNSAKAEPQYAGHWQPHLPYDVGFYNLETTRIMHRQVELAKMYGIGGFCFYYYWFSGGDKIMEKPINNWLNDKTIDFPFMLFWANEDWTNNWGERAELGTKTFSAKMTADDIELFVTDILPFIKDERYITVEGRPHIIIYQSIRDPFLPDFITGISKSIAKHGVNKPYISLVFPDQHPEDFDPRKYGADAAVEFGTHMKFRPDHTQKPLSNSHLVNPRAKVKIYDMEEFVKNKSYIYKSDYPVYKGVMSTFDNTARKIYTGAYFFMLSPQLYRLWLSEVINNAETDTVFLSAWNEWAEGMHLEPDQRYGYAYLQATREALEENTKDY